MELTTREYFLLLSYNILWYACPTNPTQRHAWTWLAIPSRLDIVPRRKNTKSALLSQNSDMIKIHLPSLNLRPLWQSSRRINRSHTQPQTTPRSSWSLISQASSPHICVSLPTKILISDTVQIWKPGIENPHPNLDTHVSFLSSFLPGPAQELPRIRIYPQI
jgi:hypothetical protein